MTTSFADLGLPARLVEALAADGITETFPVQAATLPDALAGKDLCGRAPTGSGKTLGFGIPMMVRISQAEPTKPTGLVLVPTRELAEQVQRAFVPLGRAQWRFIQAIYGGASFGPQIHSLRKGASVIVATPGRLLDIIDKGYCDLSAVEVCVVDEADRMADLGFMPDVRKILDMTPGTRQTMLWSATLDGDVNELIRDYMNDPVRHDLLDDVDQAPVEHKFVVTRPTERLDSAVALIEEHGPTIVFVKTRFGVDDVAEDLNRAGVKAGALHGARSQAVRQRVLEDFKRGRLQALVATDVAARGIHVDNVSLVLHYDMPDNDKDYTHRSGRTGRAGNAGLVIAFVPPSRQRIARQMDGAVGPDIVWEHGETPVERVPAGERETGNRDRGPRDPRGGYGDRDARGGYTDRNDRNGYRGNGYRGNDRPSYGADRQSSGADRPYSGRPPSGDRPSYGARPTYGARPSSGDRPSYGDRSSSGARPPYDSRPAQGSDRGGVRSKNDGPSYGTDRADRGGSRANDAAGRGSRDSRGGADRGHNNFTPRPPRADTPPRDRNDWSPRPRRDDDRGSVGGRFTREDRPAGARNDDRQGRDRPALRADDRSPTGRPGADHGGYRGTNDRSGSDRPRGDRPSYGGGERPRSSSERQG
ncbi:MAG: DEAD/DEAH box helicase, partial [Ilumatobacteraceae bacterium]